MAYVNYIEQMEKQYGEEWISALTPEQIQKNSRRIVKEIARGNINYETSGKYFSDLKFLENLIIAIDNELEINKLNYNACSFYFQYFPNTPNMGPHINHLSGVIYVYSNILERLQMIKMYGNIGCMVDLPGILFNYRNYLN